MKTTYFAIVAALATAASVSAASYTVSSPIVPGTYTPLVSEGGLDANFNLFNLPVVTYDSSIVGVLQSVSYTLDMWSYATVNLINSPNPAQGDFDITWRLGTVGTPNALTVPGNGTSSSPSTLLLSDSTTVNAGENLQFTTVSFGQTTPSANAANIAPFIGDGVSTVTFVFDPFAASGVTGPDFSSGQPTVFAAARINVTYTYSDIPEASTYAAGAILLAGAGLVARRRLAAK